MQVELHRLPWVISCYQNIFENYSQSQTQESSLLPARSKSIPQTAGKKPTPIDWRPSQIYALYEEDGGESLTSCEQFNDPGIHPPLANVNGSGVLHTTIIHSFTKGNFQTTTI